MNNNPFAEKQNSPWMSLIILLGLTLVSTFVVQFVILILGMIVSDDAMAILQNGGAVVEGQDKTFLYIMLGGGLLGTFLLPALFLQRLESYYVYFPKEKLANNVLICALTVAILFAFGPTMEWIAGANQNMVLPQSLQRIEAWMRAQEDELAELTKNIVMIDSWSLLIVNLFVMAVIPAIAEEYYFRGALMNIVQRMVKNKHITIFLTAFIFSFIHFQFYGFFPRFILGAFFGYMLVWTNNIWIPILAHFVNNATVTIIAFYYARQGKTYEDLQAIDGYSIIVYLGTFILTVIFIYLFYKKSNDRKLDYGKRLD